MNTVDEKAAAMSDQKPAEPVTVTPGRDSSSPSSTAKKPKEIGGRNGPEPTRFGDWEKNGRCIDF